MINLRGKIVSVMDLRKRFGETEITPDRKTAFWWWSRQQTARPDCRFGFGGSQDSAAEIEAPGPRVCRTASLNCVTGLGKHNGRLIVLLDMAKLLHRPQLKELEEAAEHGRTLAK